MHCHVLDHMMRGMMGSLLIIQGGEAVTPLPVGRPHSPFGSGTGTTPAGNEVHLTTAPAFFPQSLTVMAGTTVRWIWDDASFHTVTSDTGVWDSGVRSGTPFPEFTFTFPSPGTFPYHCEIHGNMTGTITVTGM